MEISTQKIKKTVAFLSMEKFDGRDLNSVGSSRIRARWLLPYWPEAEEYVIGKAYSTMIFQKVYWESFKDLGNYKGIKILDLCDPDWLENKPVFEYIDWVDAVTTSTEALAEYIRKLRPNKLVHCIPDRVYLPEATPMKKRHEGVLKTLAWFGYSGNFHYLYSAFDELIGRGITLKVISNSECDLPLSYRGKLKIENIPYSYESVNKEIIKADAVLMLDPGKDERGKYKSNNKILQSWALRMPVVNVPADIDKFMSGEAREKEANLRRKEVEDKWSVEFSVKEYKELIEKIKKSKEL